LKYYPSEGNRGRLRLGKVLGLPPFLTQRAPPPSSQLRGAR
jgi:hypothetical protein